MEDLIHDAALVLGSIIVFLVDKWVSRRKKAQQEASKKVNSGIEFLEQVNREVKHEERKLCHAFKAMRICVIHFSNGTFTEAGLSLFKITMKHELLEGWYVEPIAHNFQERPIPDMFVKPVSGVVRQGSYYLKNKAALELTDPHEKALFDWMGAYQPEIKSMLWLELKNKNNKIVAILCLHFPVVDPVNDRDIVKINDMKREIENIYHKLQK